MSEKEDQDKAVEESDICSLCPDQIKDVARFIPECGRFICGDCYEKLCRSLGESRTYRCQVPACKKDHTMPEGGLRDLGYLFKAKWDAEKSHRPPQGDQLEKIVKDVKEQLQKLNDFDPREHIKLECERLELEVSDAADRAIKHIEKIERDLRGQISAYEQRCLNAAVSSSSGGARSEIDALCTEIDDYSEKWGQIRSRVEVNDIQSAITLGESFQDQLKELDEKLKTEAFNGSKLRFEERKMFQMETNHLGKLEETSIKKDVRSVKLLEDRPVKVLDGHTFGVKQVIFLPDGRLASCSSDTTIKVWDTVGGGAPLTLKGHANWVLALASLSNGRLASGSSDMTIKVWDLEARKEVKTLPGHTSAIVSLKALKNGNLVSYSLDDTIKIWNPADSKNESILTISGHGNKDSTWTLPLFGVLSNDFLVACSRHRDEKQDGVLQIWDSNSGQLTKSFPTGLKGVKALAVLSNDQVAIGADLKTDGPAKNGAIKIIDLEVPKKTRINKKAHDLEIDCLLELPNGCLASAGQDGHSSTVVRSIKIWDFSDLRSPLLIIPTAHTLTIHSLSISKDETLLATASGDTKIQLWPISIKAAVSG